jgi:type I restriction enzyme S subunit
MSIKENYVEKIISGEKIYEPRRSIFKREVENVIIYATAPSKEIVGMFECKEIIKDSPENIWNDFSDKLGIDKESFFKYFEGKDEGFALKIDNFIPLKPPKSTDEIKDFRAPQSFKYVDNEKMSIFGF